MSAPLAGISLTSCTCQIIVNGQEGKHLAKPFLVAALQVYSPFGLKVWITHSPRMQTARTFRAFLRQSHL
jgi:hypothetical protein